MADEHTCEVITGEDDGDGYCGKPARFRIKPATVHVQPDWVIWVCAECYDLFIVETEMWVDADGN